MRNTEKRGFTLVELMVVIVIMGILAAVGVPKLTGAITKSKASEVAPAANSYVKLQNAYVTEHRKIGTWKRIGYAKPKSDVFSYDQADITSKKTVDDLGGSGLVGWKATNKSALGDCAAKNEWTVKVLKKSVDENGNILLEYRAEVSSSNCLALSGDWGSISGGLELSAAAKTPSNPFNTSLYQKEYDANNVMTLAKAIVSNKSTENASDIYEKADAGIVQKSFSEQYGISGYVLNNDGGSLTKETELKTWLKTQVKESSNTDYVKIMTTLDTDDGELIAGKVYRGTQSLYYGNEVDDLIKIDLYGTREVYAVYDGSKVTYYSDAELTQVIDLEKNTEWTKYVSDAADPMTAEWTTSDTLTQKTSGDLNSFIVSQKGSETSGFNEKFGIKGYVVTQSGDGLKTFLTDNGISKTDKVKIVTEVHSDYKEGLTAGSVYAATQILYYGDDTHLNIYGTRDVYALVTATGVRYYNDLECTEELTLSSTEKWDTSKATFDEVASTESWCSDGYEEKSPLIQENILKADYTSTDAKYPMTQAIFSGWSVGHKNLVKKDGTSSDWNSLYGVEGYVVAGPDGKSFMSGIINSENGYGNPGFIRSMTELHTKDSAVEVGKKYEATITMYYGIVDKVNSYGSTKVCAVGTSSTTVVYYDISECKNAGTPSSSELNTKSADFWQTVRNATP